MWGVFHMQKNGSVHTTGRKIKPMEATHFINFSGGVDSTYYLWKWLQENRSEKVIIHHCLLFQSRRIVEKKATDAILAYFRSQGWTNFDYVETEFSKKGINSLLYDIEIVFFMGGLLLKKFRKVHTIIMSRCREELYGNLPLRKHFQGKDASLNNFQSPNNRVSVAVQTIQLLAHRNIKVISPYQEKPKAEMIKEMPRELFELTWYCRNPKNGMPCEKCFNCRRVIKTLKNEDKPDSYKATPPPRPVSPVRRRALRVRKIVRK